MAPQRRLSDDSEDEVIMGAHSSKGAPALAHAARRLPRRRLGVALVLAVLVCAASCGGNARRAPGSGEGGGRDGPTYVVWEESIASGPDSSYTRIHCMDLDSGVDQDLVGSEDDFVNFPAVSGQVVVWDYDREDSGVYARDLASGEEGPISNQGGGSAAISGDWVVWHESGKVDGERRTLIVALNLASAEKRTVDLPNDEMPDYSVSGDWLVWDAAKGFDEHFNDLGQIWGMRLSTGRRMLLSPTGRHMQPAVEGGWVLWERTDNARAEALNLRSRKLVLLPEGALTAADGGRVLIRTGGEAAFYAHRNRLLVYDLSSRQVTPVPGAVGQIPWAGIHGAWVVWQLAEAGPLRATNLASGESLTVTPVVRNPAISRD